MTDDEKKMVFLCSCSALRADLDIREITPDLVEMLGWKVKVHEKEGYVHFTLQPSRGASLSRYPDQRYRRC